MRIFVTLNADVSSRSVSAIQVNHVYIMEGKMFSELFPLVYGLNESQRKICMQTTD